jgi:hypothetical protein
MPRDKLIQVKVSEEEKETIREKATRMGVQPSQYLRAVGLQFQFGGEDAPGPPFEAPHDKRFKAEVRDAVENEEPYEVRVEPGSVRKDYEETEQPKSFKQMAGPTEDEIRSRAKALVVSKGLRYPVAYAQVVKEEAEG